MPNNFLSTQTINTIKSTFTKLRQDLGRTVSVVITGTNDLANCPNCLLDPVNNESAGVYSPDSPYPAGFAGPTSFVGNCPVCDNRGYVYPTGNTTQTISIDYCTITDFNFIKQNKEYSKGMVALDEDVDYVLSLDLNTSILESGETNITGGRTVFDQADYVVVDGDNYEVVYTSKSGLGELFTLRVYIHRI